MGIGGQEVFRRNLKVGEIAAAAAGDENFFADFLAAFDHQDAPAAFARLDGAHQTGSATAEDHHIVMNH